MARRGNHLAAAALMGWIIMHASQPANANAQSTFEPDAPAVHYPGTTWDTRTDAQAGLSTAALDSFISQVGGTAFITRDGYQVRATGSYNTAHASDWSSASKPMLSAWLFSLLDAGTVTSVDDTIHSEGLGFSFTAEDQAITWSMLANQTSGYAIGAAPGANWNYNDYAVQLYLESLETITASNLNAYLSSLTQLQFQDGSLGTAAGRVKMSPRDFARCGWWFLNKFNWSGTQILPSSYHDTYIGTQQVSTSLTPAATTPVDQYLGLGTYGSSSVESVDAGWTYRYGLWHNGTAKAGVRKWPDAPTDCYIFDGHGGEDFMIILPTEKIVAACIASPALGFAVGNASHAMDNAIATLAGAVI